MEAGERAKDRGRRRAGEGCYYKKKLDERKDERMEEMRSGRERENVKGRGEEG